MVKMPGKDHISVDNDGEYSYVPGTSSYGHDLSISPDV